MRQRLLVLTMALLGLAGCDPQTEVPATAPPATGAGDGPVATGAMPEPPVSALPGPDAPVPGVDGDRVADGMPQVRSFICESGHWVELVGDDIARVTLADGRVIELPRKPDGVAEYRGTALSFNLADDGRGGVLGQDEVGGFDCEPTG